MKIKFLIICLIISLTAGAYNDHRNAKIDSLETLLKSKNPPKGVDLLIAYDELMRGYLPYNSQKCEDYARKALALSYEVDGLNKRQGALRHLGLLRYGHEEYDEAIGYFQQALAVTDTMTTLKRYTQTDIDDARSSIYGSIANVYNMQDKAHLAIHYYQLALPIFERNNWLESQTVLYYNIGELYGQMGNYQEAELNYLKASEKGKATGDSLMMVFPQKGLARSYFNKGDYSKALKTADEVLHYFQAHRREEPVDYSGMLALKARIHLMEGHEDVTRAKSCIQEALTYLDKEMMFDAASDIYLAACEVAMAERRWQQALDYGLKSVHPDSTATYADRSSYILLAQIYTELGQKEKARQYINKVFNMMNQYATDHYQSGLSQMEVLYETQKKEEQIAALDKERRQHLWLLGLATALLVAMVIGYWLLLIVQRRKKALLAAKVALETETKERRILARDLHDGLGGMLSLLRIKTEKGEPVLPLIDSIHTELRRTAHHLMPEELLKGGLVSALNDFATSIPNAQFQYIKADDVTTPLAIRRGDEGEAIELVLYRCAYELVNNALKHAKASHINIQLMEEVHQVTLTISDDGKGMEEATEGMGMQNIRERITPYKGRTDIITANGKGTDINITLPL